MVGAAVRAELEGVDNVKQFAACPLRAITDERLVQPGDADRHRRGERAEDQWDADRHAGQAVLALLIVQRPSPYAHLVKRAVQLGAVVSV